MKPKKTMRTFWSFVCEAQMDRRETRQERGYGKEWQRIRAHKFKENPLCERCERNGRTRKATIVHHKDGNQFNNEWENLVSECRECHEEIHGRKNPVRGCDVNGMPIGEHWWNG